MGDFLCAQGEGKGYSLFRRSGSVERIQNFYAAWLFAIVYIVFSKIGQNETPAIGSAAAMNAFRACFNYLELLKKKQYCQSICGR